MAPKKNIQKTATPESEPVHPLDPAPETNAPDSTPTTPEEYIPIPDLGDDLELGGDTDAEDKKPLDPVEDLKNDLEILLEGASGLVIFARDLESRVKRTLKLLTKVAKKKSGGNKTSDGPKRETNLTKKLKISPEMAEFVGVEGDEASRTQIVKKISDYSKDKNLKLDSDKRVIVLDDALAKLMKMEGGANVRFCDVQKHIKHHFV